MTRFKWVFVLEKQMFLESETENNLEMDKKITGEERIAAKLRIDLHQHENARSQLQDEVGTAVMLLSIHWSSCNT